MKTMTVSIPDSIYKVYAQASEQEKRKAQTEVSNLLKTIFKKELNQDLKNSIVSLREEATKNGLTNEKLESILQTIDNERTAEIRL